MDLVKLKSRVQVWDVLNVFHSNEKIRLVITEKPLLDSQEDNLLDECEGTRCQRGMCVELRNVCDGVTDCEDAADESKDACRKKHDICNLDPLHRGCGKKSTAFEKVTFLKSLSVYEYFKEVRILLKIGLAPS